MDKNLICALIVNATLCLMILLSYSFADNFELNIVSRKREKHKWLDVNIKTHKRSINKMLKNRYWRSDHCPRYDFEYADVASMDQVSTEISSWEILTGSVLNENLRRCNMLLAALYPGHLSKIGLPDEHWKLNDLRNHYRLHFGVDDQVSGSAVTTLDDNIESYENSKVSTRSIAFQFNGRQQTIDYVNYNFTNLSFETKSEAFISENHLVLISWNEVTLSKRNTYQRLRLRDTLGRETSVTNRNYRVTRVYRSSRLVFLQPIDSSRGTTDYSDLLECADSFSLLMNIIIVTLLLEITRNGLNGHYKFSH